jgi:hypothetical protein
LEINLQTIFNFVCFLAGPENDVADLVSAKRRLESPNVFVGLTEAYHESLCLLHYFVHQELPEMGCDCTNADEWTKFDKENVTKSSHKVPVLPLSALTEWQNQTIKKITSLDLQLYNFAADAFLDRVRTVESSTGQKILCSSSSAKIRRLRYFYD